MPDTPQTPSDDSTAATSEVQGADAQGPAAQPIVNPTGATTTPLESAAPADAAYATSPTAAPAPAAAPPAAATAAPPAETKRRPVGLIVVALVVGAVVGGVSGAGVVAAVDASGSHNSVATKPQTVTINNTDNVNATTAVAAKAGPSVVTISVTATNEAGTGSGIILSADGYVLTNTHVVTLDGASASGAIEVTTYDGKLYKAKLIGTDPVVDLAVIKLQDASGLPVMDFADSSKINVGDKAIAIGAPLGLSNTVTDGIVSAINRSIQIASSAVPNSSGDTTAPNDGSSPFNFWNFGNGDGSGSGGSGESGGSSSTPSATSDISLPVIQTDAPINPGNSGGALLDSSGKLIGINVAIANAGSTSSTDQSGSIGVGFAIPANLAKRVSGEIIKSGTGSHGLLGASVTTATSDNSSVVGAMIADVSSGGGADKAGLRKGDVVTSFNGIPVTDATDLTAQVRTLAAGSTAKMTYVRGSNSNTVDVTVGTLKMS